MKCDSLRQDTYCPNKYVEQTPVLNFAKICQLLLIADTRSLTDMRSPYKAFFLIRNAQSSIQVWSVTNCCIPVCLAV